MRVESLAGFILDLGGGSASFFAALFPRPNPVILVDIDYNLAHQAKRKRPALNVVVADGVRLPLTECCIDVTICNSVIEHLHNPNALAAEIRRVSQGYFIQTPNESFPLETHSFIAIPFYDFLPGTRIRQIACKVLRADFEYVNNVRYLSEVKLETLVPEATITYERVLGWKKYF